MLEGKALSAGCMRYWTCKRIGRIPRTTKRSNSDWDRPALAAFLHITTGPSWQWSPTSISWKSHTSATFEFIYKSFWMLNQFANRYDSQCHLCNLLKYWENTLISAVADPRISYRHANHVMLFHCHDFKRKHSISFREIAKKMQRKCYKIKQ